MDAAVTPTAGLTSSARMSEAIISTNHPKAIRTVTARRRRCHRNAHLRGPGRAGARPGQPPRPLPTARRRLGALIHQPERRHLSHAGSRPKRGSPPPDTAARPDGASSRCATFTPSSSAKSPRCSTAGVTVAAPVARHLIGHWCDAVPSQLGEHSAQLGAQVATAGPVHRPGTVGQQQAQPRDTARAHRAPTGQAQHDLVDQTHRGRDG